MTEQETQLPLPEDPAHIVFLRKEGYELETTVPLDTDTIVQVKPIRYGAPKCLTNGIPKISISKTGDSYSISIVGQAKNYWAAPTIYDISEEYLLKNGRELEMRVVDAWRELVA